MPPNLQAFAQTIRSNRLITRTFVGTGLGVFVTWNYADRGLTYQFLQPLGILPDATTVSRTLNKYFVLKASQADNFFSWFGSAVSHRDPIHLAFNLLTFSSFAPVLWQLPTRNFAGLLLGSAIASSGTWLYEQREKGRQRSNIGALGSSGIVSGMLTTVTMFKPNMQIAVMGIIPAPLWIATCTYFLVDTYMMRSSRESTVGHSAHIGGGVFGVLYYTMFLRRFGGILGRF